VVTSEQLEKLEATVNKDFVDANLPLKIEVVGFKTAPVWALEHKLHFSRIPNKGAYIRIEEIMSSRFNDWLKQVGVA
jgi:hypothetical protein